MNTTVKVWDKLCEISVHQKSKSVWIARGEYMGKSIETKGTSASSAASHWQAAAKYMGG